MSDILREAVTDYLKNNANLLNKRIYPEAIPQHVKTYPAAAISRLFVDRKRSKLGLTGISESRVSVSILDPDKIDAVRAADEVEKVFTDFFSGKMTVTIDDKQYTLHVKSIVMAEQVDFYNDLVDKHQVTSDYIITHENEV